jgi:transglutaminase-like putative cysteine protease
MRYRISILFCFALMPLLVLSQTSPITFGVFSRAELETTPYPQETGAEAVVLCDYATAKIIDGFDVEFTRHVRIKIFKPAGYSLANVVIAYSADDRISGIKACTVNLENGASVVTNLNRKQIYLENAYSYIRVTHFTMPQVREGSVIDYTYTITYSQFGSYKSFTFQRAIPVRHVEYWASIPEFLYYNIDFHGNGLIKQENRNVEGSFGPTSTVFHIYRWTGENVPAFQAEPSMPENDSYHAGVNFTLTKIDIKTGGYRQYSYDYKTLTEKLLDNGVMGSLDNTLLLKKTVDKVTAQATTPVAKMQAVYTYIQQNIKWNGYDELMPDQSVTKVHREKTGSSAEINMLLVNMLRTAGITADPVVLSTRGNGPINTVIAMASNLDYSICLAQINEKEYLLDATDKFTPMGTLPFKCLNVEGWVLNRTRGRWIQLLNGERFTTQEFYNLTLTPDKTLRGQGIVTFSGYDAINLRRLIHNEGEAGFRNDRLALVENNLAITNLKFSGLDSLQVPLKITFNMEIRHVLQTATDLHFFKPMFSIFGDFSNPWVKEERNFPIDEGCPSNEIFKCIINLPDNYRVDEIPKSIQIKLPGNDANFRFLPSVSGNVLTIDSQLEVRKSRFETNEYKGFREFYIQVSKKTNEMVILKKNNNI